MKISGFVGVFLICFSSSFFSLGESLEQNFEKGNTLYQKGDFKGAVQIYESILNNGKESAEIYFNMGNSFYKLKDYASAILYYEKARMLSPGDEDINFNLSLANLKIVDKIEPAPQFFLNRWWDTMINQSSVDFWASLSLGLLFLTAVLFGLFYISNSIAQRRLFLLSGFFSFILFLAFFLFANIQYNLKAENKFAIIFSPSVYVKSSPDAKSTDLFILHEGSKVKIVDQIGEWLKVKLANENEGWVQLNSLKEI